MDKDAVAGMSVFRSCCMHGLREDLVPVPRWFLRNYFKRVFGFRVLEVVGISCFAKELKWGGVGI